MAKWNYFIDQTVYYRIPILDPGGMDLEGIPNGNQEIGHSA
jgi:hypothetical protein